MDAIGWMKASGIGVIFGIFPVWWWYSAMIANAAAFQGKVVSKWMIFLAQNNPGPGMLYPQLWGKRYYQTILKIMAIVWVSVWILGAQYLAHVDYAKGNLIVILEINTSFPLFLLLTCIIPVYFLKRYLKHAKQRTTWNQNSPMDNE